jgi:hypothetical protein
MEMGLFIYFLAIDIQIISAWIACSTPVILLIWFFYSENEKLETKLFNELEGIYAGFTPNIDKSIAASNETILSYKPFLNKKRDPYNPGHNRKYNGVIYTVDKLDFNFNSQTIQDYQKVTYKIVYYREMRCFKFEQVIIKDPENSPKLPKEFVLHKSVGMTMDPYASVKKTLYGERSRADRFPSWKS